MTNCFFIFTITAVVFWNAPGLVGGIRTLLLSFALLFAVPWQSHIAEKKHDSWSFQILNIYSCLVVWNMAFIFPYIGNVIIPTDEFIFFQRGRSTTNQIVMDKKKNTRFQWPCPFIFRRNDANMVEAMFYCRGFSDKIEDSNEHMIYVICYILYFIYIILYIICFMLYVLYNIQYIIYHISYIIYYRLYILYFTLYIIYYILYIVYNIIYIIYYMLYIVYIYLYYLWYIIYILYFTFYMIYIIIFSIVYYVLR